MYATITALLLSLLVVYLDFHVHPTAFFLLAAGAGGVLLTLTLLFFSAVLGPLQQGEYKSTPRLFDVLRADFKQNLQLGLLFTWPFILIATALLPKFALPLFLVLLGIGLDLLLLYIRHLLDYLNPFRVVEFFGHAAHQAIVKDQDAKLCELIDSLNEVGLKSIQGHNSALINHIIDSLEKVGELFLASSKSIAHSLQSPELKSQGVKDTLSYVLLFLLQRLESLYTSSLEKKMDLVAGHVITTLTKLAAYASRIDLSLVSLPLYYVNKSALNAMQNHYPDIGVKSTMGLLELAKVIAQSKELSFQELYPPFTSIIGTLETIAQETFRQDKQTKIRVLMQPFQELLTLFNQEPLKNHQDSPSIVLQLNRVLTDFQALEAVMAAKPPLPQIIPSEEQGK